MQELNLVIQSMILEMANLYAKINKLEHSMQKLSSGVPILKKEVQIHDLQTKLDRIIDDLELNLQKRGIGQSELDRLNAQKLSANKSRMQVRKP